MKSVQIIYGIVAGLIFIVLKLLLKYSETIDLDMLLYPTNFLFSIIVNSEWQYDVKLGYYYPELHIVVNKSCSGGNFFLICFLTFIFTTASNVSSYIQATVLLILAILSSYIIAILANVSRILTLLQLEKYGFDISGWHHEAVGSFVYLTILILSFILILRIQRRNYKFKNKLTHIN